VNTSGNAFYMWTGSTSDPRALQKASSSTDNVAACWYSPGSFTVDLNFQDSVAHQVAFYLLDWDNYGRAQRVDILNTSNGLLDSRTVTGYAGGQYLVWSLSGHVLVRFTNLNGAANAVLSGMFIGGGTGGGGGGGATATFLRTDTTTAGRWKSAYGADGFNIIGDQANYPAYVTANASGNAFYMWTGSTGDPRALQEASSSTDNVAACWYSPGSFTVDLNFQDSAAHQVAFYLLDWDNYGRAQRVDILNTSNGLLDSRTVTSYGGGQYLVWSLSGHVLVRFTNLNGAANAVVSGFFFR
jgi:hypothetical protein